ncbi:MAG TPA: hypothetical protein VF590_09275 [Isosphaeraceae bacterium]|jgi:hypothetical protein
MSRVINGLDDVVTGTVRLIERAADGEPLALVIVLGVLAAAIWLGVRLMRVKGMP